MSAGYSGKPIAQKLGIRKGDVLVFLNAPDYYHSILGKLPDKVILARGPGWQLDFIQLFATERASLEKELHRSKARLKQDGMIWVSWPKSSSRLRTDLSDGVVREVGLKNGLVDVKVCAVDDSWSALKFVRRLKDREDNLRPQKRKA
jgi:bifunctional DNA-binding transcriptional regulator/antitoxin component of YhaV-PrlF toxin-antitoxin module